jgi:beta-lactamase regulating signal transducer with metallopeptidase domain/protein involved in polysaccharide export with SLBB domain
VNTITAILNSSGALHIATTLLHSLWQGGAIALLLAIALRAIPQRRPDLRYMISCTALALVVIASTITLALQRESKPARQMMTTAAPSRIPSDLPVPMISNMPTLSSAEAPISRNLPAPLIVSAWILGVILFAVYHIAGWLWLQRLRHMPTERDRWQPLIHRLSKQLHLTRAVIVIESARVAGPWVVGIFKPMILIPLGLLNDLSPQQIEAILAHELAHIRRHDYLINLIQASIETLMFYHPAIWWISSQIRQERECCCDDLAATICGSRTLYVESLLALEQSRSLPGNLALAANGGRLISRVRRILNMPTPARQSRIRSLAAAGVALACMLMPLILSERVTAQTPSTPTTTSPAANTDGKEEFKDISPIEPADLVANQEDYKISPDDLLNVSISDLVGAGVETVKSTRVSETGNITLPYVDAVKVSGMTEAEARKTIAKAFQEKAVLDHAQISVTVTEARGRTFSILGEIDRAGQYAITQNDFRVLDALVLGQAKPATLSGLYVIRKTADPKKPRVIKIQVDRLVAGDPNLNIVIRGGDMLMAAQLKKQFVHVVIAKDDMKVENKPISWDDLESKLNAIPAADRQRTVIELGVADPQMPYSRYHDTSLKLMGLVQKYKLAYYSDTGVERGAATQPAAVGGDPDAGKPMAAFEVGDKPAYPTLKDFIVKGMGHHDFDADHNVEFVIDVIHADKSKDRRLIHGKQPINMQTGKEEDVTLQPQDQLLVRQKVKNSNVEGEAPAAAANANKGYIPLMAFQLTKASPWPSVNAFIAESLSDVDYEKAEYRIDVIHPDKSKEIRLVKDKQPVNPETGKVEDVALKTGDELLLREKTVAEALDRAQPAASPAPPATPVPVSDRKR